MTSEPDVTAWVGRRVARRFDVTAALIDAFAEVSGDRSPIHMDDGFARRRGLRGRIAHGALQAALASCVLGMDLPGAAGILHELALRFHAPCYVGEGLTVTVAVADAHASVGTIRLDIRVEGPEGRLVATGSAQCGVEQP